MRAISLSTIVLAAWLSASHASASVWRYVEPDEIAHLPTAPSQSEKVRPLNFRNMAPSMARAHINSPAEMKKYLCGFRYDPDWLEEVRSSQRGSGLYVSQPVRNLEELHRSGGLCFDSLTVTAEILDKYHPLGLVVYSAPDINGKRIGHSVFIINRGAEKFEGVWCGSDSIRRALPELAQYAWDSSVHRGFSYKGFFLIERVTDPLLVMLLEAQPYKGPIAPRVKPGPSE